VPAEAAAGWAQTGGKRDLHNIARIAHLVQAGELPPHLDPEDEAARLRVLLDGLRLQLITTPRHTPASWARTIIGGHLTALAARDRQGSRAQRR
jgi:hypothetical protein